MKAMTILAAAALLAGCAATTAPDDAATGIARSSAQFEQAFNSGSAAGVAALYTDDAVVLPDGMLRVDGREGVEALWQGFLDAGVGDIDLTTVAIDDHGARATELGRYSLTAPDGQGGRVTATGNYIVVWARGEDGVWRLDWDIWNSDPA
jgi:uncharacterized protein (TIGR02246 family)